MNLIASILPIVLYGVLLKLLDSFTLLKKGRVLICTGYGIATCLILFLISRFTGPVEIHGISIYPICEELLKCILPIALVRRHKIRFMAEALIYGAAVGGGFALLENVIYFTIYSDMSLGTAIFRGFSCAILHIGCTALIANFALLVSWERNFTLWTAICLLPSIALHLFQNYAELPSAITFAVSITIYISLFIILFRAGDRKIYKWMDHSISTDIETLTTIRNGNFASTKAGQYLLSMKEQFHGETFFDMITYVELFLEMKIEKQSQLLLMQAGFDIGDRKEKYMEMKVELLNLRGLIGKTGLQVLGPLVQEKV